MALQGWRLYSGPSKALKIIVFACGIENNFSYIGRLFFPVLVKILKQWMHFDLVIPYVEMYPRKITSYFRIVMEKICIIFLDSRIVCSTWPDLLGRGLFPVYHCNSLSARQVLTNFLLTIIQQNPIFCWVDFLRYWVEMWEIWSSICLIRCLGLVNVKIFVLENGRYELRAEMNFLVS